MKIENWGKIQYRKKADRLWFEILIKRNPRCEVCGNKAVQVHHFFPKGRFSILRYNLDNGISLCAGCHLQHHQVGDPTIEKRILDYRGEGWYLELLQETRKVNKISLGYYRKVYEDLKNE